MGFASETGGVHRPVDGPSFIAALLPSTKPFMENMEPGDHKRNHQFQVLIDSDASIGWMVAFDTHHQQARQIFTN
jgi:hypothetical protein